MDISAIWRLATVAAKPKAEAADNKSKSYRPAYATPDTFVDRIYRRNLETLKLLSERSGAYAIFVPQVLNDTWYAQHSGGNWWTPHVDDQAMPTLIRRFGLTMDAICGPRESHCGVLGAVRDWKWQPDDFVDEVKAAKHSPGSSRLGSRRMPLTIWWVRAGHLETQFRVLSAEIDPFRCGARASHPRQRVQHRELRIARRGVRLRFSISRLTTRHCPLDAGPAVPGEMHAWRSEGSVLPNEADHFEVL